MVLDGEQKPQSPDSVSPELEEQSSVGLDLLQLWAWFSPFPKNTVNLGGSGQGYPRDTASSGHEASELGTAQPSPSPADQRLGLGKGRQENHGIPLRAIQGQRGPGSSRLLVSFREKLRGAGAPFHWNVVPFREE